MADLLFEADDLLQVLETDENESLAWLEAEIQNVYGRVNYLMKRITE